MSDQQFEQRVSEKLRALPNVFVYHPPDVQMARQWKPGDFIFGYGSTWGVIECKEVQGGSFPLSRWTPQQRQFAEVVTKAGGSYWLVIRFEPVGNVSAIRVTHHLLEQGSGSLRHADGVNLTSSGRSFEVETLLR